MVTNPIYLHLSKAAMVANPIHWIIYQAAVVTDSIPCFFPMLLWIPEYIPIRTLSLHPPPPEVAVGTNHSLLYKRL